MENLEIVDKSTVKSLLKELQYIDDSLLPELENSRVSLMSIFKQVKELDETHIEAIKKIEQNYFLIAEELKDNNTQAIIDKVQNVDYQKIAKVHGKTLADSYIANLEQNRNYKNTVDTINKFNNDAFASLTTTISNITSTLEYVTGKIERESEFIEDNRKQQQRMYSTIDDKLLQSVKRKVIVGNYSIGFIAGITCSVIVCFLLK